MALTYPDSRKSDHVDDYHGTHIADPYRWLELAADTPEVRAWIEAQNELTFGYLGKIEARDPIKQRLTELWDYPKRSAPFKKGGRYFQFRNDGLQNQDVLFVMEGLADEGRVLLDPNTLSEDGTVALSSVSVSDDGAFLAYATSGSGSDWQTWQVRDVATGSDLPEQIPWSKFSGATWLPDGSGFYYQRFPVPSEGTAYTGANENAELRFHALRSEPEQDTLIFSRPDEPKWMFHPKVSDDGRYLVLHVRRSTEQRNLVYYRDLETESEFRELVTEWEASFTFLGNDGMTFYFLTDLSADRGRIVAVDLEQPQKNAWRTVVPESEAHRRTRPAPRRRVRLLGDARRQPPLAPLQHPRRAPGRHRLAHTRLDYRPQRRTRRHGAVLQLYLVFAPDDELPLRRGDGPQRNALRARLGLRPCALHHAAGVRHESRRHPRTDVSRPPQRPRTRRPKPHAAVRVRRFSHLARPGFFGGVGWCGLEAGGVLAVANLRGGGEYGKSWHEAGTLARKQNVFDDFIACAEYLISENVTSPEKLAIQGGSNGGLLVGAAMTQRPELFAAALPAVGVLDMLRFHHFTIGWAWASDYGSADQPEQFETLLAYSPLHNLKEGTAYPATLITTGDFDDRVVPAHSFKFAAALQAAQGGDAPVLIRVQTKAGHGVGKPTRVLIEEQADIWAFLTDALDLGIAGVKTSDEKVAG